MIVHDSISDSNLAPAAIDQGIRPDQLLLERGGISDELENGARLERCLYRAVVPLGVAGIGNVVWIKGRIVCQRQDLAGRGTKNNDRAPASVSRANGFGERLLDVILDDEVDGERDVCAR